MIYIAWLRFSKASGWIRIAEDFATHDDAARAADALIAKRKAKAVDVSIRTISATKQEVRPLVSKR